MRLLLLLLLAAPASADVPVETAVRNAREAFDGLQRHLPAPPVSDPDVLPVTGPGGRPAGARIRLGAALLRVPSADRGARRLELARALARVLKENPSATDLQRSAGWFDTIASRLPPKAPPASLEIEIDSNRELWSCYVLGGVKRRDRTGFFLPSPRKPTAPLPAPAGPPDKKKYYRRPGSPAGKARSAPKAAAGKAGPKLSFGGGKGSGGGRPGGSAGGRKLPSLRFAVVAPGKTRPAFPAGPHSKAKPSGNPAAAGAAKAAPTLAIKAPTAKPAGALLKPQKKSGAAGKPKPKAAPAARKKPSIVPKANAAAPPRGGSKDLKKTADKMLKPAAPRAETLSAPPGPVPGPPSHAQAPPQAPAPPPRAEGPSPGASRGAPPGPRARSEPHRRGRPGDPQAGARHAGPALERRLRRLASHLLTGLKYNTGMFTINVGTWDRWLRIAAGATIVSLVFWGPRTNWGWLGLLPITTGTIRFCPAYLPFGFSTVKKSA